MRRYGIHMRSAIAAPEDFAGIEQVHQLPPGAFRRFKRDYCRFCSGIHDHDHLFVRRLPGKRQLLVVDVELAVSAVLERR